MSVWICEGGPSSPWEQAGWARHDWMHVVGSHLALDGAQRETQPGANLQKTLPACLIMRMTCSSIPRLRVRGTTVFLWSYDTFTYCVFSASIYYCTVQVWKWYSDMSDKIYEMAECISFRIRATLCLIANLQFSHCQHFPPHLLHLICIKIKIKQPWVTANAVNKQSTLHTVHWPYPQTCGIIKGGILIYE